MATDTAGTDARELPFQAVHYLRKAIAYNTSGIGSTGTVKVGTLPAGAVVEKVQVKVTTVFNAGTTNPLDVGTATDEDLLVDSTVTDVSLAATGSTFVWRGADATFAADTPIYATYAQTGTAATTGAAIIIITYTVNNDR